MTIKEQFLSAAAPELACFLTVWQTGEARMDSISSLYFMFPLLPEPPFSSKFSCRRGILSDALEHWRYLHSGEQVLRFSAENHVDHFWLGFSWTSPQVAARPLSGTAVCSFPLNRFRDEHKVSFSCSGKVSTAQQSFRVKLFMRVKWYFILVILEKKSQWGQRPSNMEDQHWHN